MILGMRIIHFSDWHWAVEQLPEADLYVCTGDMYSNYPVLDEPKDRPRQKGGYGYRISRENEEVAQAEAAKKLIEEGGGMRQYLGSPDAPILLVRGNHDFIDLRAMFEGCNVVHEFIDNELVEVPKLGITATGHRGIPMIYESWNDEVERFYLYDRARAMPMADLYVTHYPPSGILDSERPPEYAYRGRSFGLEGMGDLILHRGAKALHMFGHIHECGGLTERYGDVTFSNAAMTFNDLEFVK